MAICKDVGELLFNADGVLWLAPLKALNELPSFNHDGFCEVLGRMELIPVAFPHKCSQLLVDVDIAHACDYTFACHFVAKCYACVF